MVGIIVWIVIGGLAGWIASKFMGRDADMGILLNIVVGVIGGLLGGWILNFMGFNAGAGLFVTFLTALGGAIVLLAIVNLVRRGSLR